MIFLFGGVDAAEAHCRHGACGGKMSAVAYGGEGLPPQVLAAIQNRFRGRVVGVRPNTDGPCREIMRDIIIDGQQHTAYDYACQEPDGTWSTEIKYDVQVLTRRGNVIIITISRNGQVLGVQR